ncbi:GH14854 [Drosophila grimshawi]|uniref:GH14854 n=1 Tax=Drosophila grimshawi TaxID=7222 RepID=B4J2K8_DROGR|nr:GH14854 [Drosophila grimshawi]
MDPAKLLFLCEHNDLNLLSLLEWEEEFEQTVEGLRLTYERRRRKRKAPREWAFQRTGAFWEKDIPASTEAEFKQHFRMEQEYFDILVQLLPELRKNDTNFRKAIPIEKRIAIALYTLGSTAEYRVVGKLFGISMSMVGKILNDFCQAVKRVLSQEYLPKEFLTQQKLEECVTGFEAKGFPQCLGAIGICHLEVSAAISNSSLYYNNQDWYSKILFALVDHRFLYVNYSCPGSFTPAQVYEESYLKEILESSPQFKSNRQPIAGVEVPVLVLGDAAFEATTVMTPYSQPHGETEKQFNVALQDARQVVDAAFQQLKSRFRRITKSADCHSRRNDIIICCCILHNFLIGNGSNIFDDAELQQEQQSVVTAAAEEESPEQSATEDIRQAISTLINCI